jgi:putative DNA primase/helicase
MVYLQRIAGYCLTGLTTRTCPVLHLRARRQREERLPQPPGPHPRRLCRLGADGHVHVVEVQQPPHRARHAQGRPPGHRLGDGGGPAWAEARIKALTGGDPITARFMRQDFFTYQPHFKLLFAGNHQPTVNSVDPAMRRRFNMLPFIHKPPSPTSSSRRSCGRKRRGSSLGAAGLPRLAERRARAARESCIEATDEYFEEQDVFGQWIEERCDRASTCGS